MNLCIIVSSEQRKRCNEVIHNDPTWFGYLTGEIVFFDNARTFGLHCNHIISCLEDGGWNMDGLYNTCSPDERTIDFTNVSKYD
jgi:hypothetical protein